MPKTPKQMVKLLMQNGFEKVSQCGSHLKMRNGKTNRSANALERPKNRNGAKNLERRGAEISPTLSTYINIKNIKEY